jgi:2,3-bisphosphoglycerate-dependent phosphoglycerate mutase
MHLYIIRHAQSLNNAFYAGGTPDRRVADPQLTELGHKQAQLLARHLAARPDQEVTSHYALRHDRGGFGLTHLYTSLMVRAIATAAYVAEATRLPLIAWPEIHERGGLHEIDPTTGEEIGIDGPGRAFFAAEFPQLVLPDSLGEMGWWAGRAQESLEECGPRAQVVWRQLIERHGGTDDRVAIVTHGGFVQSLLSALLGEETTATARGMGLNALWFGVSNTSISHLSIGGGDVVVRYLNRVDHLPDNLLTG